MQDHSTNKHYQLTVLHMLESPMHHYWLSYKADVVPFIIAEVSFNINWPVQYVYTASLDEAQR